MTVKIMPQYQPPNSKLCGQTCVAMICNIPISAAIKAVGKATGTTGPDLARALDKLGIKSSPAMIRLGKSKRQYRKSNYYNELPVRCIAKCRSVGRTESHWVLVWNGETYDPYPGYVPWEYISGYIEIKGSLINYDKLNQYCELTPWRIPIDGNYFFAKALLTFSALCPDGFRHHFYAYGSAVINEEEKEKNNIKGITDVGMVGEVKIKTAIRVVVELCEGCLKDGCLVHPKVHALKNDDGSWCVSPWEAHKLNKPWQQMSVKEDHGFWIPVHDVMVYDPITAREVPLDGRA